MSLPCASSVQMGNTNMFLDENDDTTPVASDTEETTEETTTEPTEGAEVEAPATEEAAE